jgi:hypothetical protein
MPLEFSGIYALYDVNQNYIRVTQVAMAPREVQVVDGDSGKKVKEWQFLVPNDVNLGHTIVGAIVLDKDGVVVVEDKRRTGDDGKAVMWRFEPLTYSAWKKIGEGGGISGYKHILPKIKSDEDVLHLYRSDWLRPCMDWWKPE